MSHFIRNTDPLDPAAIAALAYRLWEQRGCPEGSSEADWLEAEALLRAEAQRQPEASPPDEAPAPLADDPPARKIPRTVKAAKPAGAVPMRKTRVTRARPARPDA